MCLVKYFGIPTPTLERPDEMNSTDYSKSKIQKTPQTKKEAFLSFNQRINNTDLRNLAGANLDEDHVSQKIKDQLYNATSCGTQLDIDEKNKMVRRYTCKKRFCRMCSRYRAFKNEMAYYPSINRIVKNHKRDKNNNAKLWFVTLTLPTCEADELPKRLDVFQKDFRKIYNQMKKNCNKAYCNGLRKLEINANIKEGIKVRDATKHTDFMYHPHLHVLMQGEKNAYFLRNKWLDFHPEANIGANDVTKFDHDQSQSGMLCEILKYIAKPVIDGMGPFASRGYNRARAYIYDCLIGRRTIFSYGTVKKAKKFTFDLVNGVKVKWEDDEYQMAWEESDNVMQERLVKFMSEEGQKASRSLEYSFFKFLKGVYVEAETGELLCSEKDIIDSVKEADEIAKVRKKKKQEREKKREAEAKKRGKSYKKKRVNRLKDKEYDGTKMDIYNAERRLHRDAHSFKVGERQETLDQLDERLKERERIKKGEEREYICYKKHKKSSTNKMEL